MDEALRAVADPTRRAILRLVRDDELPAGEIATHFPSMSRPAVSQHLRVLTDAGLVEVRPDGNRRLYRWRREGLRDAAAFVDEMWSDRLARLKAAAEREEWPERTRAARAATGREGGADDDRCRPQRGRADAAHQRPPRDRVALLDRPGRMCDWWGAAAELDPRPGGTCVVEMGGGAVMRGEYVELVPHERIVFTFGWDPTEGAPAIPPGSTRVEITLIADGDDTILDPAPHRIARRRSRRTPERLASLLAAAGQRGRRRRRRLRGHDSVQIPKPMDADRDPIRALVPDEPGVSTEPMFGNPGAFLNGTCS